MVLGRSGSDAVALMHGSQGLGVAPVSVGKAERLSGDGSIVRGVRFDDREVFIPVLLQARSVSELDGLRMDLIDRLAPVSGDPDGSLVDVRVEDPTSGAARTVRGIYTGGLQGDFGDGYHGTWQTLGLVFDCADPWWLGDERTVTLQPAGDVKPFLSETVDFFPVVLAQSVVQGTLDLRVQGDAPAWPAWEITGPGEDLVIEHVGSGARIQVDGVFAAGEVVRIVTGEGRIVPDRWDDVSLDSRLFPLVPGPNQVQVSLVGATADTRVRLVWQERWRAAL